MTDIAPPPDDIARLIEQAETQARVRWGGIAHEHENCLEWKTAAALRSLAQEVERLKGERDEWKHYAEVEAQVRREFKEMLDKAEAERDALAVADNHHQEEYAELAEKMAAIRDKTIEECAKVADFRYFSADAAKAIRALVTAPAREVTPVLDSPP